MGHWYLMTFLSLNIFTMPRGKHGSGQRRNRHFTRNSPFSLSEIHAATDFSIKNDAVNSQTIAQLQAAAPLGERVFWNQKCQILILWRTIQTCLPTLPLLIWYRRLQEQLGTYQLMTPLVILIFSPVRVQLPICWIPKNKFKPHLPFSSCQPSL